MSFREASGEVAAFVVCGEDDGVFFSGRHGIAVGFNTQGVWNWNSMSVVEGVGWLLKFKL